MFCLLISTLLGLGLTTIGERSTVAQKPTTGSPPKPPTPSKDDLRNAVSVKINELNISEWNQHFDLKFKSSVAHEVTAYCAKNSICLPGRKRHSENNFINFTTDQVNLVGFPAFYSIYALVAFYVNFPPGVASDLSDSIDGAVLVGIIIHSRRNIGNDIGKTISSVSRYQTQTASTPECPQTTSSGISPELRWFMIYTIGGTICGAIVLIVILCSVISWYNRRFT